MRHACIEKLQNAIHEAAVLHQKANLNVSKDESIFVMIVDDIMYLRSMRRQVYTIARDTGAALLTIYVKSSLAQALQRNSTRQDMNTATSTSAPAAKNLKSSCGSDVENASDSACLNEESIMDPFIFGGVRDSGRVAEDALRRLYDAFEPPDERDIVDRNCMTVESTSFSSLNAGADEVLSRLESTLQLHHAEQIRAAQKREEATLSRAACAASADSSPKRIDKLLRKVCRSLFHPFSVIS